MSDIDVLNKTQAMLQIARTLPDVSRNLALIAGETKRAADALERLADTLDGERGACLNCGSTHGTERAAEGRLWCTLCGYWADRRKPEV
jgi:hypothetical protein